MELKQSVEPTLEQLLTPFVEQRQLLKGEISSREKQVDKLNDMIKTALVSAGLEPDAEKHLKVVVAGHEVDLDLESEKNTLDKQKLLELGVTTEQLKAATKLTTSLKLDVRKVKS